MLHLIYVHTWKTSSTFSIDTPMNLADTSNVPTPVEVISNVTFLNLQRQSLYNSSVHFKSLTDVGEVPPLQESHPSHEAFVRCSGP